MFVFKSVSVELAKMESKRTSKTSFEKFISVSPKFLNLIISMSKLFFLLQIKKLLILKLKNQSQKH